MPADSPKSMVLQMRQQGMSNYQIIQELQNKGYNSQQVFDAMSAADPMNIPADALPQQEEMPQMPMQDPLMASPQPMMMQQQNQGPSADSRERIEEMAEAIIDEKWEELVKSINKIIEWKEKVESNLTKLEQEMKDMKESFNQLHSGIMGKITDYDQNIVNVGSELKAMEKVFQKVLPAFTENINELNRAVKTLKTKK